MQGKIICGKPCCRQEIWSGEVQNDLIFTAQRILPIPLEANPDSDCESHHQTTRHDVRGQMINGHSPYFLMVNGTAIALISRNTRKEWEARLQFRKEALEQMGAFVPPMAKSI